MVDRCAVVTGATGTLGAELVRQLAGEGMDVIAVSRSGAAVPGGEAIAADLGDDSAIEVIRAVVGERKVVIAVHAVGLPAAPSVDDVDPEMLANAVDIKAGGLLRLWRSVRDHVVPDARIVAVGGHLGAEPTEAAPLAGVANAALANLVRQLVGPVGRRGASVHLLAPGPFESPRVDTLIERKAAVAGRSPEEMRAEMLAEYPSGTMPRVEDVAGVVVSLLGPHAAALHGSTLFADGGIRRAIF